ncbi:hypothetical protein GCM10023156_25280 [Novipirellula rosea]|uniref:Secreted protein n=2 Tax=Novipirellula rosea TaxID=1031540 RepID=A0ABP8MRU2_9BACT
MSNHRLFVLPVTNELLDKKIMIKKFASLTAALLMAFVTVGCDVDKTEEGRMPNVDVDVDGDPGKLPAYDVDGPDVDVSMEKKKVDVPDVDVNMKEKEISVPDVDVSVPDDEE